jgi:hypothetical protein
MAWVCIGAFRYCSPEDTSGGRIRHMASRSAMPVIRCVGGCTGIDFPPFAFPPFISDSNLKTNNSVLSFLTSFSTSFWKSPLTKSDRNASRRGRAVRIATARRAPIRPMLEALGG